MGRMDYLIGQKELGRKVAAVWPARYPAELLWAHGVCPAEVWDPPLEPERAPAHLQPFVCAVVQRGLELLLSGGLKAADILLFPHTCDSLQNLATMVRDLGGEARRCLFFYPPKHDRGERAAAYLVAQLKDLSGELTRQAGPMKEGALDEALALGAARTAALRRLYDLRAGGGLAAGNAGFYSAVRACECLWPDDAVRRLEDFARDGEGARPKEEIPLVFSGVLPQPADLAETLDRMGVRVVEDDFLGCGRRFVRGPLPSGDDPWRVLADRMLALPPCSTQAAPLNERAAFVRGLVERSGARGVVILDVKFCEPELFDAPLLARALREDGVPVLTLETEMEPRTPAGMVTRLEAFVETLT